jgi:NitT/TauT family transport system permease protein
MHLRGPLAPAAAWGDAQAAAATPRLRAARALGRLARSTWPVKAAGGLLLLAAWELTVRAWGPRFVARPSTVLAALPGVLAQRSFLLATQATLGAVLEGLLIALAAGTVVGVAMGRVPAVRRFLEFYVNGLYAMPMVAVLPPFALWFGFGGEARLAVVVFAAFFPIAHNAGDGARSVPQEYLEVGRAYRARWYHEWLGITLPASLPYLLAGVRLGAGRALLGAIVAEFYVSINGLGFFILFKTRTFHQAEACVAVLMLAGFGVGFDALMNALTRWCMPWYRRAGQDA